MGIVFMIFSLLLFVSMPAGSFKAEHILDDPKSEIIDVVGGPEDVIWVVQLSDLHFSVHNPERAQDFKELIGPALSLVNPSLVLLTGDLTDGKSKDMLVMKQDETEWVEYQNTLKHVVEESGLNKNIFYDLRGNHDSFGMPAVGFPSDFYSRYSVNAQLGRSGLVNALTLQNGARKVLFLGLDTASKVELRGPTNLFGHPTDSLLAEIDSKLSQWDTKSSEPVTKIAFGHFPLSFSAASESGITLKDIFLNHSLSAYLCGHLHTKFGKNLKRHHYSTDSILFSPKIQNNNVLKENCSSSPVKEFWEWEMGDWRKSKVMRILAVDRGHVSFLDIDFQLGARKTIVFPTFPLDSRFMSNECSQDLSSYMTIRALVFSVFPIESVTVRIHDLSSGNLHIVLEESMTNSASDSSSTGNLYMAPWNFKAFEDPSPNRFWLQIEVIDINGESTLTELRPFSINGLSSKFSWTWKEFLVMGCQWDALYYPMLWSFYFVILSVLIIPKVFLMFSKRQYSFKNFKGEKTFLNGIIWILSEMYEVPFVWSSTLSYLFYLILFPWIYGRVFSDEKTRGYMTYKGWVLKSDNDIRNITFVGSPDIIVVVLPHLLLMVLPSILVSIGLAAERTAYREYVHSQSGKKADDNRNGSSNGFVGSRWIRKLLVLAYAAICWKHFKRCRALVKAYEMNPLIHFPIYSFFVPILLAHVIYKTMKIS
ncbi:putative metallophosphoesterase At3g03305 [Impatiens glandulifera]|uniref:putative metallophosphoesterase At3g03305 n=1 Tax=Impatiens glandulifera TaxID=253017 RepID=UPI001FB17673|nr:putative metallophosphoesterase At3g03305 [Impatiens glandulifera]